jgi:hypothetical protein
MPPDDRDNATSGVRAARLLAFEKDAELLVAHQLDLLSQIEAQLRAVHHTMQRIQRLRSAKLRVGPELTDRQRQNTLFGLSAEVEEIDNQIAEEHNCCMFMQQTVVQMQERLVGMKRDAAILEKDAGDLETTRQDDESKA